MEKNTIQFPRFLIRQPKAQAIQTMNGYVNSHLNEFLDGEEIAIKYINDEGGFSVVNAVVSKEGNNASVSVLIGEADTLKIVAKTGSVPPTDKESLWLSDSAGGGDTGETTTGLTSLVNALRREVKRLQSLVDKHEYAFRNTIAGGDIITNSEKYDRENEYDPEQPEDAKDYTKYAESDFEVRSYDIYLGSVPFKTYCATTSLYKGQNYYLKFYFFNAEGERIREEDITNLESYEISSNHPDIAGFKDGTTVLRASKQGGVKLSSSVELSNGAVLRSSLEVFFKYNEEPYFEKYEEPNVHHILIKSASSYEILTASTSYLCSPEFVWCEGNNTLYLKAKASNGTYQIFKISGKGGDITGDTGSTTEVVIYELEEDGTLTMSGETISLDDNGILILPDAVLDDDGILNLNNVTGSTTGETSDIRIEYNEEDGMIDIYGDGVTLDDNGVLIIPENVMSDDGYIHNI